MANQPAAAAQAAFGQGPFGGALFTPLNLMNPANIFGNFGGLFEPASQGPILSQNPFSAPSASPSQINNAAAAVQASPTTGIPVLKPVTGNDAAVTAAVTNNAANKDAVASSVNANNGNLTLAVAQRNLANAEKRLADVQASLRGVRELTPAQRTVLIASQRQVDQAKQVVANFKNQPATQLPIQNALNQALNPGTNPLQQALRGSILPGGSNPAGLPAGSNLQAAWDQFFGGGSAQALGVNPQFAGGIPTNPLANTVARGLQIFGNPATIPKSYLEWKENVDIDDYLSARKFLTWKEHCKGRPVDDWLKYEEWKPNWNTLRSQVSKEEFDVWRKVATEEEAKKYLEWREWRRVKQHFKSKYEPYRQRSLTKRQKMYKKFIERSDFKEYKKYKKFLDWVNTRSMEGKDIYDIKAWEDWVPTYIENEKKLHQDFDAWKASGGTRTDFGRFVEYLMFRKIKQAYKDETEVSEDSQPCKFYKDRNFLRRHRRYWKAWDKKWDRDAKDVKNYNADGDPFELGGYD